MLLKKDLGYVDCFYKVGFVVFVCVWLEGDWMVVEGVYFDNWLYIKYVIEFFEILENWICFWFMDWGFVFFFLVGWWVIVLDEIKVGGCILLKGVMVCYCEWYGLNLDRVNIGFKLMVE